MGSDDDRMNPPESKLLLFLCPVMLTHESLICKWLLPIVSCRSDMVAGRCEGGAGRGVVGSEGPRTTPEDTN